MSIIAEHGSVFLILACCFGFFMAWGIGANDVANAMGTSYAGVSLDDPQLRERCVGSIQRRQDLSAQDSNVVVVVPQLVHAVE